MWKTMDGYTLTMPQSELEALASMFPGGECGCKECGINAVAQELDRYISNSRLLRSSGRTHGHTRARGRRHTRAATQRASGNAPSATFGGGSGSSSYQFRTRPLPGNRRLIYAYTPPPWAYPSPPPPPPACAPDDPSGAPPAAADADADAGSGDAPADGDAGERGGTLLDALVRGR